MVRYISFCLLLVSSFVNWSQVVVNLDTCVLYTSLEEAMQNPTEVYRLKLTKKKYSKVPDELFLFENLMELDLSKNKLIVLPAKFETLTQLRELKLNKNKFEVFPIEITTLLFLQKLEISQNYITAIPVLINKLQDLEYLNMWSNELYVIPDSMGELNKLKELDLRVIQYNAAEQKKIAGKMPNVKIHFSNPCACAN